MKKSGSEYIPYNQSINQIYDHSISSQVDGNNSATATIRERPQNKKETYFASAYSGRNKRE